MSSYKWPTTCHWWFNADFLHALGSLDLEFTQAQELSPLFISISLWILSLCLLECPHRVWNYFLRCECKEKRLSSKWTLCSCFYLQWSRTPLILHPVGVTHPAAAPLTQPDQCSFFHREHHNTTQVHLKSVSLLCSTKEMSDFNKACIQLTAI